MRIFVAGATGVIGRRVIPRLVDAGHRVTGAARTPVNQAMLERMGTASASVDLFTPATLANAVRGHETVVNLATHVPPSWRAFLPGAWRETDRIRRIGAANLMEAALAGGARRFIQESFAPVYPDLGEEWIDERVPVRPGRYNRHQCRSGGGALHLEWWHRHRAALRLPLRGGQRLHPRRHPAGAEGMGAHARQR